MKRLLSKLQKQYPKANFIESKDLHMYDPEIKINNFVSVQLPLIGNGYSLVITLNEEKGKYEFINCENQKELLLKIEEKNKEFPEKFK